MLIEESGLTFGPFQEARCFHIEKSRVYRSLKSVTSAEFLLLREKSGQPMIWMVEAKSSSPKDLNPEFLEKIRCKFTDSFLLLLALLSGRHPEYVDELPADFKELTLDRIGLRFVLVIKGHQPDSLPPLRDALVRAMKPLFQVWRIKNQPPVIAINEQGALEFGLVERAGTP